MKAWEDIQVEELFRPAFLPEPPWLILAPHPDDETLGMGGTIIKARKRGYSIKIVFITNGELFADPFVRKKEAQRATTILGLSDEDIDFWEIPDSKVFMYKEIFKEKFLNILNVLNPATIFLPSFMEHHYDHRAVAQLGQELLRRGSYRVKLWFYEVYNIGVFNRLIDISKEISKKERAARQYRSQIKKLPYHKFMRALNFFRSLYLNHLGVRYAEAFLEIELS